MAELQEIKTKSSTSTSELETIKQELAALKTSHGQASAKLEEATTEVETLQSSLKDLQASHDKLEKAQKSSSSQVETLNNQLEQTRTSLAETKKKAEASESKKEKLQAENAALVEQLEEVRGKVVEVMQEKAALVERVEAFDTEKAKSEKEVVEERTKRKGLEDDAKVSVKALASMRLISQARRERITFLEAENVTLTSKTNALDAAEVAQKSLQEQVNSITAARTALEAELEELRGKVSALEEEIAAARLTASASTPLPQSPGDDTFEAQRALDASLTAQRLRDTEHKLHQSESKVHALSRQLAELSNSAPLPKPSSRSNQVDAHSMLPAATRHKRQVSLSLLKARIESSSSRPGLSPAGETIEEEEHGRHTQFGDELMFACKSCQGDLIML